jgi:UDP-GlcNAc:undecaprenyl-phosphate GlcNAc-1-phosphate transferase
MYTLPILLAAFLLSMVIIRLATPVAIKLGLVDKPGGHKLHEAHTPLVGGIAIFLCVGLAWWLAPNLGLGSMNSILLAAGGLLFATGLVDDRFPLSVKLRFGVQIIAAGLLVYSQVVLVDLGYLLSSQLFVLGLLGAPLTLFATVGAINALNMIDGVDGLAGSVSFVSFGLLLIVAFFSYSQIQVLLILCILGGLGGFLVFNMPWKGRARASIFMGDAGSTLLGFLLAYLLISLSQGQGSDEQRGMAPVVALWIFAVPLLDTVGVMVRRIWMKRSPFAADRGHIHHLFLDAGFRVRQAVLLIAFLQLVMGAIGLAGYYLGVPDMLSLLAFMMIFTGYIYLISRPWRIVPHFRTLHQRSGLTVRGVQHVYVGNLGEGSACSEMEALLGEQYAFELYQARAHSGSTMLTYALVDAGESDHVKALLAHIEKNRSVLANPVINQYIPRDARNDRRESSQLTSHGPQRRKERRAGRARLIYRSQEGQVEAAS